MMKCTAVRSPLTTISADIAALFLFQEKKLLSDSFSLVKKELGIPTPDAVLQKDFSGKEGESHLLYTASAKIPRLLLIGLGESTAFSIEKLRRASATMAKRSRALKASTVLLHPGALPSHFDESGENIGMAIAEGVFLSLYKYDKFITANQRHALSSLSILVRSSADIRSYTAGISQGRILAAATNHARDLTNAPGSDIFPESLAADAQRTGRVHGFSVTVFNKRKIEHMKMGGVIAVSKGSEKSPRFIVLEHGKQYRKNGTVVLVGKGVTFDSGGISIKPSANMAEMKMDMGGAAAVIGAVQATAQLKLKKHVVGLIPSVENMPSGSAVKPGDIIRHFNGKTSEVDNTDAEGRLILADALSYAEKFKPSVVIDVATLTGAVVVALGHYATGMMGNNQRAMDLLKAAGEKTYERVCQLPMYDEYEKLIKSDVADVKNVGGRWAGAITAAWFLKKFIGDYKWIHLDIAGTAILESDQDYTPRGGSGVGVRLLVEFLRHWK